MLGTFTKVHLQENKRKKRRRRRRQEKTRRQDTQDNTGPSASRGPNEKNTYIYATHENTYAYATRDTHAQPTRYMDHIRIRTHVTITPRYKRLSPWVWSRPNTNARIALIHTHIYTHTYDSTHTNTNAQHDTRAKKQEIKERGFLVDEVHNFSRPITKISAPSTSWANMNGAQTTLESHTVLPLIIVLQFPPHLCTTKRIHTDNSVVHKVDSPRLINLLHVVPCSNSFWILHTRGVGGRWKPHINFSKVTIPNSI